MTWRLLPALLVLLPTLSRSAVLSPVSSPKIVRVSASVARALTHCKCATTPYLDRDNWVPQPCAPLACLGFAAEIVNKVDGDCPELAGTCNGPATNCSGDLKVTITSSADDCCTGEVPGGYAVPAWGAGCTLMGNAREHTYTGLTKLCAVQKGTTCHSIEIKHCGAGGSTIVTVNACLICGDCNAH